MCSCYCSKHEARNRVSCSNCIFLKVYLIFNLFSPQSLTSFHFQSYMVIEFDKSIHRDALHWLIDRFRKKKQDGGAQLLIRKEPSLRYIEHRFSFPNCGFINNSIFDFETHKFVAKIKVLSSTYRPQNCGFSSSPTRLDSPNKQAME